MSERARMLTLNQADIKITHPSTPPKTRRLNSVCATIIILKIMVQKI